MIYPSGFESNLVVFIYLLVKDDYLYIYLLPIFCPMLLLLRGLYSYTIKKEREALASLLVI